MPITSHSGTFRARSSVAMVWRRQYGLTPLRPASAAMRENDFFTEATGLSRYWTYLKPRLHSSQVKSVSETGTTGRIFLSFPTFRIQSDEPPLQIHLIRPKLEYRVRPRQS